MSIFECLFPCALQSASWKGFGSESCMSGRMGANASALQGAEGGLGGGLGLGLNNNNNNNNHHHHHHHHHQGLVLQSGLEPPGHREKKKRVTGFATLKKKLIRRRRSSKACDHGRVLRELVMDWSPLEIAALLEEYDALQALKDLCVQAELARPPAATFKQDLSALYDFKYCTDADLVYRGACFPIHRALISARCPYFRDLLAGCPGYGARICLDLRSPAVDVQLFSALLRYLYTGDICHHNGNMDLNLLRRLREEFGSPNPLEVDLRYLLESGDHADAVLIFTEGADGSLMGPRPDSAGSEYGFRPRLELPCHRAVLAARSPFFRSLLARRARNQEERQPTRIILDEGVIPKRYARVLLHAVYLDQVDLNLISRAGCGGGLGEAHALAHTGRTRPSPLEEAMELYQIGRFLELDILAQGCEDLILEALSLDTLPVVLQWSSQPHGSAWVHRQAMHFLREEFQPVAQSHVLHQLDKNQIIEVLKSPFLQASELEVLQSVLKWGEYELIRRMEDREPNVVSHTAHSVTRKGVKKRDLSDVELREILSDFLPCVRMDHVLPPNSDILQQAIRRGLVSTPPSHMIGGDHRAGGGGGGCGENLRLNAWIRGAKTNGLFVQPRLFIPYYDELKVLVEDQLVQEAEMLRGGRRVVRCGGGGGGLSLGLNPADPDISYMSESRGGGGGGGGVVGVGVGHSGVDVLGGAPLVPDTAVLNAMLKREHKLRKAPSCQLALSMPLGCRAEIGRQIRLRVVREFNLPDNVAEALEAYRIGTQIQAEENLTLTATTGGGGGGGGGRRSPAASSRQQQQQQHQQRRHVTPPLRGLVNNEQLPSSLSADGRLPDVAMGPSSSLMGSSGGGGGGGGVGGIGGGGSIPPNTPSELRLDLGDGPPPRSSNSITRSAYRLCPPGGSQLFAPTPPAPVVPRFL